MSLNEMVISQSSAMGPCRTHNENIRLHSERTPCWVEDQWSGLMKGGWWLEEKREGEGDSCGVDCPAHYLLYPIHRRHTDLYRNKTATASKSEQISPVCFLIHFILIFPYMYSEHSTVCHISLSLTVLPYSLFCFLMISLTIPYKLKSCTYALRPNVHQC